MFRIMLSFLQDSFVESLWRLIQHMMPSLTATNTTIKEEDIKPKTEKDKKRTMLPFLALPNDPKVRNMLDDELKPPVKPKEEIIEPVKVKEKEKEKDVKIEKKRKSEKDHEREKEKEKKHVKKEQPGPDAGMDDLMAFFESQAPSKQTETINSETRDSRRRERSRSRSRERRRSRSPTKHKSSRRERSRSRDRGRRRSRSRERRNRSSSRERRDDTRETKHSRDKHGSRKERHKRNRSRSRSRERESRRRSRSRSQERGRNSHATNNRDMFVNRPPDENPVVGKVCCCC